MNQRSTVFPLVIIFALLTVVLVVAWFLLKEPKVDIAVLLIANCLFFASSMLVFRMQIRAMQNNNPNVFIRSVMGGMMLKMAICLIAVMGYVLGSGKNFNKPSVYISMLIYMLFLVVEVGLVMKLNKRKNA